MRRYINLAFIYAILAMVGGVFYREFTKIIGFTGRTTLSFVHTHLFLLGMIMFLIVSLFAGKYKLEQYKKFKIFMVTYNIGVPVTALMLVVRGILQAVQAPLSKGLDASISGIAGIGHILAGVGIIFFLLCLKEITNNENK